MESKTKIYFGIILTIAMFIAYYIWERNQVSLPIDNKYEAIAYAKTDVEFQQFINGCESKIGWTEFDKNIWLVRAFCTDRTDSCYDIQFEPNGQIVNKGPSCIV